MLRSHALLAAATALVTLTGSAAAQAATPSPREGQLRPQLLPEGTFQPYTDNRFAALFVPYQRNLLASDPGYADAGRLYGIRDDETGQLVASGPGCQFTVPQGGYAGEQCPSDGVWRAVNLRTGARAPLPLGSLASDPTAYIYEVGHDWAFWRSPAGRSAYLNWRTGEQRTAPENSAQLDYAYNRAAGGTLSRLFRGPTVQGIATNAPFPLYPSKPLRALRLKVNGRVRTIRDECEAPGCGGITYNGGVLTWHEGGQGGTTVGAYIVQSNRLLDWTAPVDGDGGVEVRHTARRIYINTVSGPTPSATSAEYEAVLPRR